MKNLFHLFTYVCLVLVLLACKQEDEEVMPEVVATDQWQLDERFLFDRKAQYNTYLDTERNALYFMGSRYFSKISMEEGEEGISSFIPGLFHPLDARMPISSNIFTTGDGGRVRFIPTEDPISNFTFSLDLEEFIPNYGSFNFPHYLTSEAILINSKNECLIPYYIKEDNLLINSNLLKVDLTVERLGARDVAIDTVKTQIIELPYEFSNSIITMQLLDDNFYVTTGSMGTYKVKDSGELTKVLDERLYRIFKVDGQIFGFGWQEMYTSSDGLSWTKIADIDPVFQSINMVEIEGRTIGHRTDQIFLFTIEDNTLSIVELTNEGLEGNQITSVAAFNGKVYVTTLSGVFTKSIEDFFTEKAVDEEENEVSLSLP
ncbi:MAG: hypothetical protein ACFB0B_06920 [Thermonemataceae bacterium]